MLSPKWPRAPTEAGNAPRAARIAERWGGDARINTPELNLLVTNRVHDAVSAAAAGKRGGGSLLDNANVAMDSRLKVLNRQVFHAGSLILREGEHGQRAFVVESGEVEIWRDVDGKRHRLGLLSDGGIFGEMALIDNQPRVASATALTDTTCVVVPGYLLQKKLDDADPFIVALLRVFVSNIRSLTPRSPASDPPAQDTPSGP